MLKARIIFSGIGIILVVLMLRTPFLEHVDPASYAGGLLLWAGILEILHGFRRAEDRARSSAWFSGSITLLIGTLLINASLFQYKPLVHLILFLFLIDAARYLIVFFKGKRTGIAAWSTLISGLGNLAAILIILFFLDKSHVWVIALAGSLRIFGTLYNLFSSRMGTVEDVAEDVVVSLGVSGDRELENLAGKLEEEDEKRASIDAGWIITFLLILFFIHLGRMGLDRSRFGILSPVVAVIGDMFIALVVAFGIIAPARMVLRRLTGLFLGRLSKWVHEVPESERKKFGLRALALAWIKRQLRLSISIRKSGYSFLTAVRNGLKIGLPFAAILAAVMPVLGMSWYFDTENWASGIWDGYAGTRTETWREAIVRASDEKVGAEAFQLHPGGVSGKDDFSFVVVGDPGEGDASQLILKDQILAVSNKSDVRFVIISSDIVYPSGAMRDYERKFFLPFKGLKKPIYAIPGNHDWYDALEGFTATFFTPQSAKRAMEARIKSDLPLTDQSRERVNDLIKQADFLRSEYDLPTGYQNAPFFQISNDHFVLLAIDTGVRRKVDGLQLEWIRAVLEESNGKYVMALLGHPFYAIGEYQGDMNEDFRALHELLKEYDVPLVMAGDTHDLEYYKEFPDNQNGKIMHHFVNGGGGAYLSIGAAMNDPESRPTADWANYPSPEPLIHKIDSLTPSWKFPAWIWVKKYDGYPFSAEWLSAAFDYNQAPYFQSFMEIKVEKTMNRIRLIPYGINGQLRWKDFQHGGEGKPSGKNENELVEWVLPMKELKYSE